MDDTVVEPFKVGDWLIEPKLLRISKMGEVRKLEFKTMEILRCFVANQGEVVSKNKLHEEVWGEVFVTDNALTRGVSKLRKAFDDDPLQPNYIETISKSGYRLIAPIRFNGELEEATESIPFPNTRTNMRWLLGLLAVFIIGGLSLVSSISSTDGYSAFYDPAPVSTLVGPERGHAISPDGEKITFSYSEPNANNSDVYVKLLDDLSQVKFTNLKSHQGYGIWSPDGNYMAYVSTEDGNCGVYKEPSFGGAKTRIGDCYQQPRDFVWSPDGKTIAFSDVKPNTTTRNIFFLDVATQASKVIFTPENGVSNRSPVFSPNGEFLIFRKINSQGNDIYKLRLADTTLTRLTFDNARMLGLDIFDKGQQIAFSSDRGGTWALWKVSIDGGIITRFHINDRVPTHPKFAANGKRMIYKSLRDQTQIWAIENQKNGFKTPVPVASSTRSEIHPSLSNNGDKVVFISNRSGHFEIWFNNFEQHNPTKLTALKGSFINMPSWSIDDSEVVFDARIDGNNAVYILDIASKMTRTFIDLEGDQVNAHYARDGKAIYFASNHTGNWQIWKKSVFEEQAPIEQVTVNGGYYLQEGFEDGYLYYSRLDTAGLWRMKEVGKPQAELFIPNLSDFDWGNWVSTKDGIIYIDRGAGIQIHQQSYDRTETPDSLYTPSKRIQSWGSSLSATVDGSKIIYVQIENSEDELMMVDFR